MRVCRASLKTVAGYYQYREHLNSSVIEANELGQVISYEEYYPYGRSAYRAAASGVDLSLKRYRFTGKERDEETGLDYFGVRYYASWLGRWTSGDPGGFVDGLNLYRYVRNNPINGVDSLGYNTDPPPLDPAGNPLDLQGGEVLRTYGAEETIQLRGGATGYVTPGSVAEYRTSGGVFMKAYFYADTGEFSQYHPKKGIQPIENIPLINTTQLSLIGTAPSIESQIGPLLDYVDFVNENVDGVQAALGLLGMIPVLGEPADLADGIISLVRGDWKGAALSFAAMIPVFGNAASAGKLGTRAQKWSKKFEDFHDKAFETITNTASGWFEKARSWWNKGGNANSPTLVTPNGQRLGADDHIMQAKKYDDWGKHPDGLGENDKVPLPNKNKRKQPNDPNLVKEGRFPKNPTELEELLGIPKGSYHQEGGVKAILKGELGLHKKHPYGKNPDFGVSADGLEVLVKPVKGKNAGKYFKTGIAVKTLKQWL